MSRSKHKINRWMGEKDWHAIKAARKVAQKTDTNDEIIDALTSVRGAEAYCTSN